MSKPLELVAFVPITCSDGCCKEWIDPRNGRRRERNWLDRCPNTERLDYDVTKRISDVELAAEYWAAAAEAALELAGELDETDAPLRALTLRRFATHPHHDEEARA